MLNSRILLLLMMMATSALAKPEVLWSRTTEWGEIQVMQEGDARTLIFHSDAGETVESRMSLSNPWQLQLRYTRQMMAAVALWESLQREPPEPGPQFLLVGLGGASLSKAIARQFPGGTVTTVEIEPLVVEAAREWFSYRESERVVTVVDDARHFLETSHGRYDVILVDAFDEEGAPRALRSVEFFALLEQHLHPGGVVISNLHYDPWLPARRYLKSAASTFPTAYAVDSPLNGAVVFSREPISLLRLWEQRRIYERRYSLPVTDLLSPRLTIDLDQIQPYRDGDLLPR